MVSSKTLVMGIVLPWREPSQPCGSRDTSASPSCMACGNPSLGHGSRAATAGWCCAGDKQPDFSSGAAPFSAGLRVPIPLHSTDSPLGHSSHVLAPAGPAGVHASLLFLFQGFLGHPGPVGEKGEKGAKVRVSVLALCSPAWGWQGVAPSLPRPPSPKSRCPSSLRLLLAFPGGEGRNRPPRSCWASRELTGKPGVSCDCSIPFPGLDPFAFL